ncbi:uncharacterized protein LOC134814785 isoform X4 [Bolinopsis microptera]|uniref:uncharacterized protein LOC134814785 isoform X4 n=1 Tax=Bolinopsis microptera TaxID=2820187 RepID=UPI00307AF921
MKTWTLVLLLIGVTETAHFCFPKQIEWTGAEAFAFTKAGPLDLFFLGREVGQLPESADGLISSSQPAEVITVDDAPNKMTISWDLLSYDLTLKNEISVVESEVIHTVHTSDAAGAEGLVKLTAAFTGLSSDNLEQYKVTLECRAAVEDVFVESALTFVLPEDAPIPPATFDVTYAIIADTTGTAPDTLAVYLGTIQLTTSDTISADCTAALKANSALDGRFLTIFTDQASVLPAKITWMFPSTYDPVKAPFERSNVVIVDNNDITSYVLDKRTNTGNAAAKKAYSFDTNKCINIANYQYASDASSGDEKCPADRSGINTIDCLMPAHADPVTEESKCNLIHCCWVSDSSRCVAAQTSSCKLEGNSAKDLADNPFTKTIIDGRAIVPGNYDSYDRIYLGQAVTFKCKQDSNQNTMYMLRKDDSLTDFSDFGDFTSVSFNCIQDVAQTTDIMAMYNLVKCEAACTKPTIDDTVVMDLDFETETFYPAGTEINLECKPGYGRDDGTTAFEAIKCSGAVTNYSDKKCYQCDTSGVTLEADAKASFLTATALVGQKINYQCDTGTSFVDKVKSEFRNTQELDCIYSSGTTSATISGIGDITECREDCPLTVLEDHGILFKFDNEITTILSVPQDEEYELGCENGDYHLPYGQEDEIECEEVDDGASPSAIVVQSCHAPCDISTIKTEYNVEYAKIGSGFRAALNEEEVALNTPLFLSGCKQGVFLFTENVEANTKFFCDASKYDFNNDAKFKDLIKCYNMCQLPVKSELDQFFDFLKVEDNGGDTTFAALAPEATSIPPNTKVQFQCKDLTMTVEGTTGNIFEAECGTNGDDIVLKKCYPSCSVTEIPNPNANTIVSAAGSQTGTKVALGEQVVITCSSDDYVMAFDVTKRAIGSYAECKTDPDDNTKVELMEAGTHAGKDWCLAVPKLGAPTASTGSYTFTASVVLPSDRDTFDDWKIYEVQVADSAGDIICTITTINADSDTYDCPYTLSTSDADWKAKLKHGFSLHVYHIIYPRQEAVYLTKNDVTGFYVGPPPLDAGDVTISVVGAKTVTMIFKDTLPADIGEITVIGSYVPVYAMKISEKDGEEKQAYDAKNIADLVSQTEYDWSSVLEPLKSYVVVISSSTEKGPGGDMTKEFNTGHASATITDVEVSSTARDVTIKLADTSPGGNTKVKYTLSSKAEVIEEKDFGAAKEVTISYDDLTPLTEYTFTVTVLTDDDTPSETATHSFTQGPTLPTPIDSSKIVLTDNTATVEFMPEEGFTYRLKVSKKVAEVWTVVMEYVYPEPVVPDDTSSESEDDTSSESEDDTSSESEDDTSSESEDDTSSESEDDTSSESEDDTSSESEDDTSGEGGADNLPSRRKRDVTPVIHEFTGLESNVVYKISMTSEGNVGETETVLTSDPVEVEFTTYACSKSTLTDAGVTVSLEGSEQVVSDFLSPDSNVPFTLTCPGDLVVNIVDSVTELLGNATTTSVFCLAAGWGDYIECVEVPEIEAATNTQESDVVVGIVLGILAVLIIVGIILILIYKRNKERGGGGTENGTSQKYSPRDNEKQDKKIPADEAPVDEAELTDIVTENPYANADEQPDIPAKEANGDNVSMGSQEAKVELGDEEEAVEVAAGGETAEEKV